MGYTDRLYIERDELEEKIVNLSKFIECYEFDAVDEIEQSRLQKQLSCMREYFDVLRERIKYYQE